MEAGEIFGRWSVVGSGFKKRHVLCRCRCGTERDVYVNSLTSGLSKSCGCYKAEQTSKRRRTHGHTVNGKSKEYLAWVSMIARCKYESSTSHRDYGARGIRVCEKWQKSFEAFLEDVGHAPSTKHSIERLDFDGHYEPSNVVWATVSQQANNKRNNKRISIGPRTQTLAMWLREKDMAMSTYRNRLLRAGMSPAEALTKCIARKTARGSRN